eukprot:2198591-Rhodomonas_salina.2
MGASDTEEGYVRLHFIWEGLKPIKRSPRNFDLRSAHVRSVPDVARSVPDIAKHVRRVIMCLVDL